MVRPGSIQDVADPVDLGLGPFGVHGTTILPDESEDSEQAEGDNGFFVNDEKFVADSSDGETSTGGEDGSLGDQAVAGKGVEDGLRLGLGVGKVALVANGRRSGGESGKEGRLTKRSGRTGGTGGST